MLQSAAACDVESTCQSVVLSPGSGWLTFTSVALGPPADTDTVVVKPAVASAETGVESGVVTTLRPLLHKTVVDAWFDATVLELSADAIAVLENCPQPV